MCELGVLSPVDSYDPVGFTVGGDVKAFWRCRPVDLKRGRISMGARMGDMTPEIFGKWHGHLSPSLPSDFADISNVLAAVSEVPAVGAAQVVAYFGFVGIAAGSLATRPATWATTDGKHGDLKPSDEGPGLQSGPANSRVATVAISAMFVQSGIAGTTGPER